MDPATRVVEDSPRLRRTTTAAGVLAPLITVGAIALAVAVSPTFSLATDALSRLGAADTPTAALFNGGLIVGGLVGLGFAIRLYLAGTTVLAAGYGVTTLAVTAVGLFPIETPLHAPVAIGFFLGTPATLALGALADPAAPASDVPRSTARRYARGSAGLAVASVLIWPVWAAVGVGGVAVPETGPILALTVWSVVTAARIAPSD